MWRNLNLRSRILLGYGLVLVLAAGLALFLVFRVGDLNSRVKQLNSSVTFEATAGARVAAQVAATQRLVERYLRQPQPDNLQSAQFSLQELTSEIERSRATLTGSSQRQRLDDLEQRLAAYLATFQSLSTLIKAQEPLRDSLNTHLARSNTLLKGALTGSLSARVDMADIAALIEAQTSIQQANLWVARMTAEQSKALGANALAELNKAKGLLTALPGIPGSAAGMGIANTLNEIAQAAGETTRLQANLEQVQQQRDTQLDDQGRALKQQADAIARAALDGLTVATADLEQQTLRVQQIAGASLMIGLLLAVAVGARLAETIAEPIERAGRPDPGWGDRPSAGERDR